MRAVVVCCTVVVLFADVGAADEGVAPRAPRLLAVFIGGKDSDPTRRQIAGTARKNEGNSGLYQLCREMPSDRVIADYFNWNGTTAGRLLVKAPPFSQRIADHVRRHVEQFPGDRVAIVGNSWGGHTALEVTALLAERKPAPPVHLLVFLDPSSAGRKASTKLVQLQPNVRSATQYHTHNLFCWQQWTDDARLLYKDLGDPKAGYMHNGKPAYADRFNFRAHVAAEWDNRIHEEIKAALLRLIEPAR